MSSPNDSWSRDPLYLEGLQASQTGNWARAEQAWRQLLEHHSGNAEAQQELQSLLGEARLRMSLDQAYGQKIAKARKPLPWRRIGVWSVVVAMVGVLAYTVMAGSAAGPPTAPTLDAQATQEAVKGGLLQQARAALAAGQYAEAIALLQDLVSRFPLDTEVGELLRSANQRWQLANLYAQAQNLLAESDWLGATAALEEIQRQDPGYRDSAALLEKARLAVGLEGTWLTAAEVFGAGNWLEASRLLEGIRQAYPDFRRAELGNRLYQCYMNLGLAAIERAQGQPEPVREAAEWFSKALTQKPADSRATMERRLALSYPPAQEAFVLGHLDDAIARLRTLYDARFSYMDGLIAQMLYDAYMQRGLEYEMAGELELAVADYAAAERLTGPDTSEASQKRLALTLLMTPTPAPPTPTPFVWNPNLIPTQPAEPTPVPLSTYKGQIAFWTDREGVTQVFLMNSDGTNQRPANLARWGATEFESLRKSEMISPDGLWQLYVASGNNRIAQIWIQELENGTATGRNKQLTSLDDVCYDPVWSPDGWHIAFVSEHTGSDDIWVMTADGMNLKQLTKNDWEWEKHPSWSPDGQHIVYWSNKDTGHQQIWIMNADGSDQRNLSNNEYNDWNPIWIK